jgi:histone deacetylase 6
LEESNYNWIGSGAGMGYNCNIPLNKTGMGNTEFLTIWHQILLPMAYKVNRNPTSVAVSNSTVEFNSVIKYQLVLIFHFQFNPDLVIVSAGFDAALGCPEVIKNESS